MIELNVKTRSGLLTDLRKHTQGMHVIRNPQRSMTLTLSIDVLKDCEEKHFYTEILITGSRANQTIQ